MIMKTSKIFILTRDFDVVVKTSKLKLQEAMKQRDEEIQICAWELYALVVSVSKYKE